MPDPQTLLLEARRRIDPLRGFELAATLSRLHRVQGGDEIVVAVEHVAQLLDELGIEHTVEKLQGPLGLHEHWGLMEPRGWRLHTARVEALEDGRWKTLATTEDTPLVAVAGTPPGSFEGEVSTTPSEGAVLLTPRFSRILYYEAASRGVGAIVAYHSGPGVRYWALYPPLALPEPPRIPAVSIPLTAALRLTETGGKVRVTVESELHTLPTLPILRAWVGSGPHEAVMVAHICHPRPGSHDNASGVATTVEALASLAAFRGELEEAGLRVTLLLVPEWTGTAAAVQQGLLDPASIVSGLSVDMVAANLALTGGSMRLIRGPPPLLNPLDPLLDHLLATVEGYAGMSRYEMGSDHDVLLGAGVPASMLNEWPDRYYHTSLDTPDHLSVERLAATAAALAAAHRMLATRLSSGRLGELLAHHYPYNTPVSPCSPSLLSETAQLLDARLKGETPPPPQLRPPILSTYLYHAGRREQALRMDRERGLTERLNAYTIVLAATGSEEDAAKAYTCLYQAKPDEELAGLAREFLEGKIRIGAGRGS